MIGRIFALLDLAVLGAVFGAVLGVLCGFAYTTIAQTSSFEGYSGMLVFFGFAPVFALFGAIILPAVFAVRMFRGRPAASIE